MINTTHRASFNHILRRAPVKRLVARDGVIKYLFPVRDAYVETVVIPANQRMTACLSVQVGCRMACQFCATGQQKWRYNLTTDDILNQIISTEEAITHIVFMGMGEPFDTPTPLFNAIDQIINPQMFDFAPRRISVSTAGVLPGVADFLNRYPCPLSVSLHSPFHEERMQLMPIEKRWPIEQVIKTIRSARVSRKRRFFFEYLMLRDQNHTPNHAEAIARLLDGINARINLMRPHPTPGSPFSSPSDAEVLSFRDQLNQLGIVATIRASRGHDINAACGMLSTQHLAQSPRCTNPTKPDPIHQD